MYILIIANFEVIQFLHFLRWLHHRRNLKPSLNLNLLVYFCNMTSFALIDDLQKNLVTAYCAGNLNPTNLSDFNTVRDTAGPVKNDIPSSHVVPV